MQWQFSFFSVISAATSILLLWSAFWTWRKSFHPAGKWCFWMLISVFFWVFSSIFETAASTIPSKVFFGSVDYLGIPTSPVFYFLFTLTVTNIWNRWIKPLSMVLLTIASVFILINWTNPLHHLFWKDFTLTPANGMIIGHGPLFWAMSGFLYVMLITGLIINFNYAIRSRGVNRKPSWFIFLGAFAVFFCNVVYVTGLNPLPGYDFTPLAYALSAILLSSALPKYDFQQILPIARHRVVEAMQDALLVTDFNRHLVDFNPAAAALLKLHSNQIGRKVDELLTGSPQLLSLFLVNYSRELEWFMEEKPFRIIHVQTVPLTDETGVFIGMIATLRDITQRKKIEEELKKSHEELKILASTDETTGTVNRRTGLKIMEKQLNLSKRNIKPFVLCFIDVNDLKSVNDNLGHAEGDNLIITVADLLKQTIRNSDTLVRFGGDEFLVLFPDCSIRNAEEIIRRGLTKIREWNKKSHKSYQVSFSYGFSEYLPPHDILVDDMIRKADRKMYEQKKKYKRKSVTKN